MFEGTFSLDINHIIPGTTAFCLKIVFSDIKQNKIIHVVIKYLIFHFCNICLHIRYSFLIVVLLAMIVRLTSMNVHQTHVIMVVNVLTL